jgi:multiple sugar transport system ATP-binding protein
MRTEIKKLHHQLATTIVYVTHDQVEAMTLADRIVVLKDGKIEQIGTPEQVYNNPNSIFVAGFIGAPTMNFVPCRLIAHKSGVALKINNEKKTIFSLPEDKAARYQSLLNSDLIMGIRPEYFSLADNNADNGSLDHISTRINVIEPLGSTTLFFFEAASTQVVASLEPIPGIKPGDQLHLKADMSKIHLFNPQTGKVV